MSKELKSMYDQADHVKFEYVRGGKSQLRPNWCEPWYCMPCWIGSFWQSGSGQLRLKKPDITVPVRPGDLVLIPPTQISSVLLGPDRDTCVCWMHFKFTLLDSIDLLQFFDLPLKIAASGKPRLGQAYSELHYWAIDREHDWCLRAVKRNLHAFEFLSTVFEYYEMNMDLNSIIERRERFKAVIDYMQSSGNRKIELAELAAMMNMSLSGFQRHFKQAFGEPPGEYMRSQRLAESCRLLTVTSMTIAEVAERCGFCDQFQFSKVFRKHTGQSPSEYRKYILGANTRDRN